MQYCWVSKIHTVIQKFYWIIGIYRVCEGDSNIKWGVADSSVRFYRSVWGIVEVSERVAVLNDLSNIWKTCTA